MDSFVDYNTVAVYNHSEEFNRGMSSAGVLKTRLEDVDGNMLEPVQYSI